MSRASITYSASRQALGNPSERPTGVGFRTALALLVVAAYARSASGQSLEHCRPGDPTGYYAGIAVSGQSGRLELSLNLKCAKDRYTGSLATPLGTFPVTDGQADADRLHLVFTIGADVGTIDARTGSDTLQGSFLAAGDSGSVALSRIGDARAPGWDAVTLTLTTEQWREDLAFFAREIVARHANPFHATPRHRFDSLVAALDRRLDRLNGDQAYVELDRLANLIGDAHTYIEIPENTPRFPFAVRRFGTTYRVVATTLENERLLGTQLLKIQGVPTLTVIHRLWPLTPSDENLSLRQSRAEGFLSVGMILHGIGLTPVREMVTLTVADDAGHEFQVNIRALPGDSAASRPWKDVFTAAPLYLRNPSERFWHQYLPQARTMYCSFRGYDSLPARAGGLIAQMDRIRPEKLVIDLRQNGGGDYMLGLKYLIEPISRRSHINQRGNLFVIIGRNAFSAGMANAAQFRMRTSAILVGETIGERPNGFQEPREIRLPNSHLKIRYSTQYYRFVDQGPNAVDPDHRIPLTWRDYRAGHDLVLEWILHYPR